MTIAVIARINASMKSIGFAYVIRRPAGLSPSNSRSNPSRTKDCNSGGHHRRGQASHNNRPQASKHRPPPSYGPLSFESGDRLSEAQLHNGQDQSSHERGTEGHR